MHMVSENIGLSVIIPAYNESENLPILIPRIREVAQSALIIVVDDSVNRDKVKTGNYLAKLQDPRIQYIPRSGKLGRGSAVLNGISVALRDSKIRFIVEMDADLAHDPNDIPRLISAIKTSDMVVGSRYLSGSAVRDWPWYRLWQSRTINFFLRFWLGLKLSDYTNGYRIYTRKSAEFIIGAHLKESGFIALSEIAYRLKKHGFRISEIAITFTDRKYGKSSADIRELARSLIGAIRIRLAGG